MSILLDVSREDGLLDEVHRAVTGTNRLRIVPMNVLKCDHCGAEVLFQRTQDVEVLLGWIETAGGVHRCPRCRTRRAVQRDRKTYLAAQRAEARRLLADRGITDPYYVNLAMRLIGKH